METAVQLRKAVAEFFEVDEGQVGPSFSLSGQRGQGSIARAALDSVIRNRVGIKSRAVYTARTFGELEGELVPGAAVVATAPAPGPVESPTGGYTTPAAGSVSCGVDIESIENLPVVADHWEDPFYRTVFDPSEIAYCLMQETPALHFAARWCAKEALKKCDRDLLAADLKDLEVVPEESGAPYFVQHVGSTSRRLPHAVSLSHTSQAAVAVVVRAVGPEPSVAPLAVTPPIAQAAPTPRPRASMLLVILNLITLVVAILALLRTFPPVGGLFAR